MSETWAEIFIETCLHEGVDTEIGIIEQAEKRTELYESKVVELLRSKETEFGSEIQFSTCSCGSDLMYDNFNEEFYCPICD